MQSSAEAWIEEHPQALATNEILHESLGVNVAYTELREPMLPIALDLGQEPQGHQAPQVRRGSELIDPPPIKYYKDPPRSAPTGSA
jgi:hypothetical protein